MSKIANYKPASRRQLLAQDLAKALAYQRAKKPDKANDWARKLVADMLRLKLLREEGDRYAAYLKRWRELP
jgi:hypothetical protein